MTRGQAISFPSKFFDDDYKDREVYGVVIDIPMTPQLLTTMAHVPSGNYEIRFGFNQSDARGIAQFYVDGKICGIPVDMREGEETKEIIGWFDESNMEKEEIEENDKAMRNRGWMKGPASVHLTAEKQSMRVTEKAIRRIVGTFRLDNGIDHWLRFKDVREAGNYNELSQDYLEIVPISVLSDPTKPEDQNYRNY